MKTMKETTGTDDIFYPGNLVINDFGLILEVVNESVGMFPSRYFSGKVHITNNQFKKGTIYLYLLKPAYKQYKSEDMSELKTTKEKVLEAASKCPTAKATLEILFPEAFKREGFARFNMKDLSLYLGGHENYCKIFLEGDYIKIRLPLNNNDWFFEAFEWVKKFINQNDEAYLEANRSFEYSHLYINVSSYK